MFADLQDVDEEEAAAQRRAERQRREQEVDDLDDDDEFADFLDDDEDAGDGRADGEPRRRRRAALARALPSGVSAEAFQVSYLLHMEAYPRLQARGQAYEHYGGGTRQSAASEYKSLRCPDAALVPAHWPMLGPLSAYTELWAIELLLAARQ